MRSLITGVTTVPAVSFRIGTNRSSVRRTGHGAIVGNQHNDWQDTHAVLALFAVPARKRYRDFIAQGSEGTGQEEVVDLGFFQRLTTTTAEQYILWKMTISNGTTTKRP